MSIQKCIAAARKPDIGTDRAQQTRISAAWAPETTVALSKEIF